MTRVAVFLLLGAAAAWAQVKITPEADRVRVEIDGKPFTDFYMSGAEVTKPYLHPVRSASGRIVTRRFPMEKVAGEPTDHQHHRGVWFAHAGVNHVDFWNNEASYTEPPKKGKITLAKLGAAKNGKQSGSLAASFNWTTRTDEKLLTEDRVMVFHAHPTMRMIDLDVTLTAARQVSFLDEKDGVFGVRIAASLQEEKGTGRIVNAEGLETEKAAWGKPSEWVDYAGEVEGEKLGIAILSHPLNSRPTRWHVRGYGLFAANPFGTGAFAGARSPHADVDLEEGGKLRFRYRLVIHPGDAKSARIADLYTEWSR